MRKKEIIAMSSEMRTNILFEVLKNFNSVEEFLNQKSLKTKPSKKEKPIELVYKHTINTDEFSPYKNWTQETHIGMGEVTMEFNPKTNKLYINKREVTLTFIEGQENGKTGYQVRDALTGEPVLNACILEFLLSHPHMIPEHWKKDENGNTIYIFFWGTVYRRSDGRLYVRCLCWSGSEWYGYDYWLDS